MEYRKCAAVLTNILLLRFHFRVTGWVCTAAVALPCATTDAPAQGPEDSTPGAVVLGTETKKPFSGSFCSRSDTSYERWVNHCGAPFRAEHCYCNGGDTWVCTAAVALPCSSTTMAASTRAAVVVPTEPMRPEPDAACQASDMDYEDWTSHCGKAFRAERCHCNVMVYGLGTWLCLAAVPLPCPTHAAPVRDDGGSDGDGDGSTIPDARPVLFLACI